ncbi:unnamed protein product [Ambrosiozyma monospora]|uniref:Unnamed protein product n=1 Tax=Ambrosiozyma monospora TaxID=43982 RepID=A0A9W6YZ17_AMBMO|nr:unnamed protein product [Ambrosiozyma monospora]
MNEKLAGLTLLAFANGAPDMFSTYIAMDNGSTSLAIGELLGSANFALTVVFGSMMIVQPFQVDYKTFIRDVSLFAVLITISLLFLWDGKIAYWESIAMCLLYVCYILLSIFFPEKFIDPEQNSEAIQDGQYPSEGDINDSGSILSNESLSNRDPNFERSVENLESGLILRLLLPDSLKLAMKSMDTKNSNKHNMMFNGGSLANHHHVHFDEENNIDGLPDLSESRQESNSNTVSIEVIQECIKGPKSIDSQIASEDDNENTSLLPSTLKFTTSHQDHFYASSSGSLECNSPIEFAHSTNSERLSANFPERDPIHGPTLLDKVVPALAFNRDHSYEFLFTLLTLPLVVPFNLIIPTPPNGEFKYAKSASTLTEWQEEELSQRIQLFHLQVFVTPFIFCEELSRVSLLSALGLVLINFVFQRFICPNFYKRHFNLLSCFVGFITTLNMITFVASEIVTILENIGLIYHIQESILGMTILSIGNSIGDLITNVTLASQGLGLTGLHASSFLF